MPVETRFAVARDESRESGVVREWWQLPREAFAREWDTRKLFTRRASALAVIWKYRDQDHSDRYRFVLVCVTRDFSNPGPIPAPPGPTQEEARVP